MKVVLKSRADGAGVAIFACVFWNLENRNTYLPTDCGEEVLAFGLLSGGFDMKKRHRYGSYSVFHEIYLF